MEGALRRGRRGGGARGAGMAHETAALAAAGAFGRGNMGDAAGHVIGAAGESIDRAGADAWRGTVEAGVASAVRGRQFESRGKAERAAI